MVELYSSVECKGIVGNDNRHYVLDLLRTFPPDANYLPGNRLELWPVLLNQILRSIQWIPVKSFIREPKKTNYVLLYF